MKRAKIFPLFQRLLLMGLTALFSLSCNLEKKIVYFQGSQEAVELLTADYSPRIQPDDILEIAVYADNVEVTKIFGLETSQTAQGRREGITYLVDSEGYIDFPVLGRIKLGGMTRVEAVAYMKGLIEKDIQDPFVSITLKNFRITILGAVRSPKTYDIEEERITLLQAIGLAGDLDINGERENVMVIREEGGERKFYRVDLTSEDVFESPVYYLAQNDVIYVQPNRNIMWQSKSIYRDLGFITSITGFIVAMIALISR